MILFLLSESIETAPSNKMTLGILLPQSGSSDAEEATCHPMCVADTPSFSGSYSAYSLFNTPATRPPTQLTFKKRKFIAHAVEKPSYGLNHSPSKFIH